MRNVVVLVDFQNVFNRSVLEITEEMYLSFFTSLVEQVVRNVDDEHDVNIRLYGGWYRETTMSNAASLVQSKISHLRIFENYHLGNRKRVRGKVELALMQNGLDEVWYNTLQEKQGLPRLRIDEEMQSENCKSNESRCPVHILKKFVNNKRTICQTEGCHTIHQHVFYRFEQKMVDTMMTCDTFTFASDPDVHSVYVVSDDIDLFPGIAISKVMNAGKDVHLMVSCAQTMKRYACKLNHFNIDVQEYLKRRDLFYNNTSRKYFRLPTMKMRQSLPPTT